MCCPSIFILSLSPFHYQLLEDSSLFLKNKSIKSTSVRFYCISLFLSLSLPVSFFLLSTFNWLSFLNISYFSRELEISLRIYASTILCLKTFYHIHICLFLHMNQFTVLSVNLKLFSPLYLLLSLPLPANSSSH